MAMEAFDLAERFQTPIFVMSDLDLGMNNWMSDPFKYPEGKKFDRGKVLNCRRSARGLGSSSDTRDVDGDGIPYRTLPGTDHPQAAYFTRGSGHNEKAIYSEKPDDYKNNMDRLNKKYETSRDARARSRRSNTRRTPKIGFLAFGTTHWAIIESLDQLQRGAKYARQLLPPARGSVHEHLVEFFEKHDRVYVVEQNRDGQMAMLIRLELPVQLIATRSAASGTTAESRSMPASLPTRSSLQRKEKK